MDPTQAGSLPLVRQKSDATGLKPFLRPGVGIYPVDEDRKMVVLDRDDQLVESIVARFEGQRRLRFRALTAVNYSVSPKDKRRQRTRLDHIQFPCLIILRVGRPQNKTHSF